MSPRMAGSSDSKGTAAGMEAAVGEVDRLQVKESRGAVELSPPSASSCRRFCEDCEEHLRSGPRLPDHRKLRADEVLPNDTCRDENGDQDSGRGGSGSERFDGEFARTTLWANAGLEACSCTSKDKGEGGGCPSVADSKTVNLPSQETVSDSNIESQRDSMSLRTLVVEFGMEWKRRMAVRWRRVPYSVHLLFFTAGGIIGLVAALFYLAASRAEHVQVSYYKTTPWAMWLALPFGLPAILAVTRMFFDGCAGSGIPLEMWGMNVVDSPQMARVLSLRIAAGKFVLTVAGLLIGASTGREGPTVQISSSIFHEMIRLTRRFGIRPFSSFFDGTTLAGNHRYGEYLRISILVGGAAGIAGAFNTPLGGMIFAIEEMGHVFSRSLGHIMFCNVTVSAAVSIAIVGFYQWYGSYSDSLTAMQYLTVVPTVGILGGLLGGLWSLVLLAGVRLKQAKQLTMLPSPYILALLCGCGVVLTGWFTGGETYGSGYSASAAIISPSSTEEEAQPTVLFGPLKMVATWAQLLVRYTRRGFCPKHIHRCWAGKAVLQILLG